MHVFLQINVNIKFFSLGWPGAKSIQGSGHPPTGRSTALLPYHRELEAQSDKCSCYPRSLFLCRKQKFVPLHNTCMDASGFGDQRLTCDGRVGSVCLTIYYFHQRSESYSPVHSKPQICSSAIQLMSNYFH